MPSERILNKLFEIAQENTSEEVNYNDFVKDLLNSANLTIEDKIYNAEDEYFKNLLALAKHDSRIFGEYRNGKFVISDSIIKSAQKETKRQIDIRKAKVNDLTKQKEPEKDNMFESLRKSIKDFSSLTLDQKLTIMQNVDSMTDEEFSDYSTEMTSFADDAEKEEILDKKQADTIKIGVQLQDFMRKGKFDGYTEFVLQQIKERNPIILNHMEELCRDKSVIIPNVIKKELEGIPEFATIIEYVNQNRVEENISFDNELYEKDGSKRFFRKLTSINNESLKEIVQYVDYVRTAKDARYLEEKSLFRDEELKTSLQEVIPDLTYEYYKGHINNDFETRKKQILDQIKGEETESISHPNSELLDIIIGAEQSKDVFEKYRELFIKLDGKRISKSEGLSTIADKKKEFLQGIHDIEIEDKKASEKPGLGRLAIFDSEIEGFDIPTFEEFADVSPVTDVEFAEAFDVTEIGRAKTEEPKTVDTALEEEPGKGEGSGLPSSITIEKINSDAVSPVRKDDKLETKSVIKFAETFVKSSSYLKKMKDVKEFAHAGIDNNKSTEIGDIA